MIRNHHYHPPRPCFWVYGCVLWSLLGCSHDDDAGKPYTPPEPESHHASSVDFAIEKQRAAGIVIQELVPETGPATRRATGWLEVPPGRETIVRAATSGFLATRPNQQFPRLGDKVQSGEQRVAIQTILTPAEIAQMVVAKEDTDIEVEQSKISMELAEAQLNRLRDARETVTATRIDELRDRYEKSKAALKEAQQKLPYLLEEPYAERMLLKPYTIDTPFAGVITQTPVAEGQLVLQGDSLWTISDWSQLWLRVPLFEDYAAEIDANVQATVSTATTKLPRPASYLTVPIATRPHTRTIDLLFAVENSELMLRPGQTMTITLPLTKKSQGLRCPRSAIIYDNLGNTFVFVALDENHFERRRVELDSSREKDVGVSRGLVAQDRVVVTGAQLLYAEEFKGNLSAGDDD